MVIFYWPFVCFLLEFFVEIIIAVNNLGADGVGGRDAL